MNQDDATPFSETSNDLDQMHRRYLEGVKKALLIGIGNVPSTEDKYKQALEEVLHNSEFWHDPEIYDAVHYAAYGKNYGATKIRHPNEKSLFPSDSQAAIAALPVIEAFMTTVYDASMQEIMGNYYLGTPLSPVNFEASGNQEEDYEG